jgi:hypothetical protein
MRALVDKVRFESKPEAGTIVHLEKNLEFDENSPVRQLMERREARSGDGSGSPN